MVQWFDRCIQGMNSFSFENHLLCETQARKGYVFISFNSKGTERRWGEPTTSDYESQIHDIQFVIGREIAFRTRLTGFTRFF